MKTYEIKIYSNTGTLLGTINPRSVAGVIAWNESLNGGQGDIGIEIQYLEKYEPFIEVSNILEIREVDEENKIQSPSYTGIIEEYEILIDRNGKRYEVKIYGVFTALNDIIFDNGSGKVFTITNTPGNIAKIIIDYFNAQYGALSGGDTKNLSSNLIRYTGGSIDVTGSNISINFNYNSCKEAIEKVLENTNLRWYIGQDGICYIQPKPSTANHRFDFEKDIQIFKYKKTKREMVNKVYLERSGGTIVAYSDSPAITTYKLKESKQTDSSINDLGTQNIKGNQYILDHKDGEFEIEMTINPMRSQDIKPGQIVRTQNANVNYDGLEIVKIDKNESSFTLFFQKIQTLGETIKNIV